MVKNCRAGIIATGSALPSRVVTNEQLIELTGINSTPEWILEHTGIVERRIAEEGETNAYFGAEASKIALKRARMDASAIDRIIVATTTPDRGCPATAPAIQELIGARDIPAHDLAAGCAGFTYALVDANSHICSGAHENVLVVGVDLLSKITNYKDRSTCILLADGAGAAVVSRMRDRNLYGINAFELGADGSKYRKLFIPNKQEADELTSQELAAAEGKLFMDGQSVFKFAAQVLPRTIYNLCNKLDTTPDQVDLVIPHQANLRIIAKAQQEFGSDLPLEKFYVNIQKYGNTSAASIIIALDEWVSKTEDREGKLIFLVGFGAGLTWGGISMSWAY